MIFAAIVPFYVWVLLALGLWGVIAHRAYRRIDLSGWLVGLWLALLAVQALAASISAVATRVDSIDRFTCYWGIWGWLVQLALAGIGLALLVLLMKRWPRNAEGGRRQFGSTVALWGVFSVVVVFAHLRSAVLCTV